MHIIDEDSVKDINNEERAYQTWVRERKNHILSMSDSRRKQEQWRNLFPQVVMSDDYLRGNVF
jgi:hypothetical protein